MNSTFLTSDPMLIQVTTSHRFLLPRLHLDRLAKKTSVRNLRKALKELPSKLDDTYRDAMTRVKHQDKEHYHLALRTLSWISKAKRPLKVQELQHAVSVERTDRDIDDESLVSTALITSVCAGLVSIDTESNTFRLVHFTVEEFFEKTGHRWFPHAERLIAETCIVYLLFDEFGREDRQMTDPLDQILEGEDMNLSGKYSLLSYAAQNWTSHATPSLSPVRPLIEKFLSNEMNVGAILWVIYPFDFQLTPPRRSPGLHLLARLNCEELARFWISSGADINARDSTGHTALSVAMATENYEMARLLIDHQADVNQCDYDGTTPLMLAVRSGREREMELLINAGADPTAKGEWGRTCLHDISRIYYTSFVSLDPLLQAGADIEARTDRGSTPFLSSLEDINMTAMRLFLEHGAKVDFAPLEAYDREAPFLVAMQEEGVLDLQEGLKQSGQVPENKEISELLLQHGVDLRIESLEYFESEMALLITAPSSLTVGLVNALLRAGVKFDTSDENDVVTWSGAVKQHVDDPTGHNGWIRFSKSKTSRILLEKHDQNTMPTADDLPTQSDKSVKLFLLWKSSWERRRRVMISIESLPSHADIWTLDGLKTRYSESDERDPMEDSED